MGSSIFPIWIVLIGFMFYFMMIRPQKKARAQQVDMLQHLKPGAEVRTTAQIMGTVVEVGDDWAIVETTPGTRIKFGKPAIVGIVMPDDADTDADAPTPGGIGDAPSGDRDQDGTAHAVQDAVPVSAAAVTANTVNAVDAEGSADDAAELIADAQPAKS